MLPPAPSRLVAVGDLHGDLDKARRALVAARVLDPSTDRWSGGDSVLVQVGDVLDRGDGEIACLFLLERLAKEAALVGGAVARVSEDWQPRQTSATLLPSRCKTVPYVSCL